MTRLALLLALAGALLAPAAAGAQYAGERPARNVTLDELVELADRFWTSHGVTPCPGPDVRLADELAGDDTAGLTVAGRATFPEFGCVLWVDVDELLPTQEDPAWARHWQDLCALIVHERGHNAGLEHTAGGIMGADAYSAPSPGACVTWGRAKAAPARARERAAHARRRAHEARRRARPV